MADDAATFTVTLNDKVSVGAKSATGSLDKLDSGLKKTSASSDKAGASMSDAATGGCAALAGAIIAVETAAAAAVIKMAEMSLKASEMQESMLALAKAEYGSDKAARAVVDAQYAVGSSSSLAQDAVTELGTKLERAGVSAGIFRGTLKAMADQAAVAGEAASKPIEKVIKKVEQLGTFKIKDTDLKGSGIKYAEVIDQLAKDTGQSVDQIKVSLATGKVAAETGIAAMSKVLESKFGGAAASKMLGFDTQVSKAKENLSKMFKDVAVGPFLKALQRVLSILDPTTKAGHALKGALTGAMNGFFKVAAAALPYIERFFLEVFDAALDVVDVVKPIVKGISHFIGLDTAKPSSGIKAVTTAAKVLVGAVVVLGIIAIGAVTVLALPFIVMGVAAHTAYTKIGTIKAAFTKVKNAVKSVGTAIKNGFLKGVEYVEGLPAKFADMGQAAIDGFVDAIKNGAAAVIGAVKGVMSSAIKAGKEAIGMKSPAKRFGEMGDSSVAGYVNRVDAGRAKVQSSVKHLLTFPKTPPANDNGRRWGQPAPARTSAPSGGTRVEAGGVVINIIQQPGQSQESLATMVRRELVAVFDQASTGTGGR